MCDAVSSATGGKAVRRGECGLPTLVQSRGGTVQPRPETRKTLLNSASGDPVLRGLMRNQGVQSAAEPDRISAGFHRRVRGTDSAAASFSPPVSVRRFQHS